MIYLAVAIGVFYVVAGFVVMRAMMTDKLMNQVLAALNSSTDHADALRNRILSVGSYLTLASGAALTLLSPLAVVLFAANTIVQGGYLIWAHWALPPADALEARGRRQTTNAFVLYLAAAAFVAWLALQGHLRAATIEALALDAAIIVATAAAAHAFIRFYKPRSHEADLFDAAPDPRPPTRLRLAPEFHCHPLWDADTGQPVNPLELPLPDELAYRIEAWDDTFQSTFDEHDPAASDFASPEARAAYFAEGRAIAAALREVWQGELDIAEDFR